MREEIKKEEKFLIDINDKRNWLQVNYHENAEGEVDEEQRIIVYPEGENQRFDFTDSIFYGQTTYHEHNFGWENFFVTEGTMDFTVHGKTATVHTGDMLVVQPYCSHQMVFLEPSRWRATFHDMGMSNILNNWDRVQRYHPDWRSDPEMTKTYLANRHNILREAPYARRVDKSELYEVRNAEKYLSRYDLDGVVMKQMSARWENNGVQEIWLFEMEPGFHVEYEPVVPTDDFFYVTEGELECHVGNQVFTAYHDCLIRIPTFVPRSFVAKSRVSVYDLGGITHWLDGVEDWLSLKNLSPERYADKELVRAVLRRHDCYVKSFGKG